MILGTFEQNWFQGVNQQGHPSTPTSVCSKELRLPVLFRSCHVSKLPNLTNTFPFCLFCELLVLLPWDHGRVMLQQCTIGNSSGETLKSTPINLLCSLTIPWVDPVASGMEVTPQQKWQGVELVSKVIWRILWMLVDKYNIFHIYIIVW